MLRYDRKASMSSICEIGQRNVSWRRSVKHTSLTASGDSMIG